MGGGCYTHMMGWFELWNDAPFWKWYETMLREWKLKWYNNNHNKISHLTSQRTETKWVQEVSSTNLTNVRHPFPRFGLRPLIQEQNPGTVDHICLHSTNVQHLLNFCHPHYIMIWRSSYLNQQHHKNKIQ